MEAKYRIRFFFDHGSGTCLWSGNDLTRKKFNYAILPEKLPLSMETTKRANDLVDWYDQPMNLNYPPHPSLWRQEECDRFNKAVEELICLLKTELGDEFELVNEDRKMVEDPDLDEYLKDPKGFKR